MLCQIVTIPATDWTAEPSSQDVEDAQLALEQGNVLHFTALPFALSAAEGKVLDATLADPKHKNISLPTEGEALRGMLGDTALQETARGLVARFREHALGLVDAWLPHYRGKLRLAPTSLRLNRVEGRKTSWRKDDARLHVDAFPSRPLAGERILRVFMNINPDGAPREWRVGESFEDMAQRFMPRVPPYRPAAASLLAGLGVTKGRRTAYDHLMLGLHDAMKADMSYQAEGPQTAVSFPPGAVWVCFSDQTSHAAMAGQFMLEQTLFAPLSALRHPQLSPLRVLERLSQRALV
jgi:hypothetical protein